MDSVRELYRIGMGPSSSHTMGPRRATCEFLRRCPKLSKCRVTLFGSLAATGRGHLTDDAIGRELVGRETEIRFCPDEELPLHPNGMLFEGFDETGELLDSWRCYSVGGGMLREEGECANTYTARQTTYALSTMDEILKWSRRSGRPLWNLVDEAEGPDIWEHLRSIWRAMEDSIGRGLEGDGVLPGTIRLRRKARAVFAQTRRLGQAEQRSGLLAAFALAVAEDNAGGGIVATAPTCGSAGVVPAVLHYLAMKNDLSENEVLRALATAGLVGNVAKHNASISGAEVGCQGEIGVACAMAAAAAAQILGASSPQIEYAAEMGLEHHLGLTCDPIAGLVQIPCIERNAMGAMRALDCAEYALLSDGQHFVTFDTVVRTMKQTGHDLPSIYRETAAGGLATAIFAERPPTGDE